MVDVERELYNALKRLYDWTGNIPDNLANQIETAIKLYEQKGKV